MAPRLLLCVQHPPGRMQRITEQGGGGMEHANKDGGVPVIDQCSGSLALLRSTASSTLAPTLDVPCLVVVGTSSMLCFTDHTDCCVSFALPFFFAFVPCMYSLPACVCVSGHRSFLICQIDMSLKPSCTSCPRAGAKPASASSSSCEAFRMARSS
jgi:hypothetical protein